MGRSVSGGASVVNKSTSDAAGSTVQPDRTKGRVEGLPLVSIVGSSATNYSSGSYVGCEIQDSYGNIVNRNSYADDRYDSNGIYNNYSTTYYSARGSGYGGDLYRNEGLYVDSNPSTSNYSSSIGQYGIGSSVTSLGFYGNRMLDYDWDFAKDVPLIRPRVYSNGHFFSSSSDSRQGEGVMHSGTWVGPEGTRQDHALIKGYNSNDLIVARNQRRHGGMFFDTNLSKPLKGDKVNWWNYTGDNYKSAVGESFAQSLYHYGSRYSYNEKTNKLACISGYSSGSTWVHIWTGATGKNLYDISLEEWLNAASVVSLTQSGAPAISGNGGYGAKVHLCDNDMLILSWKNSSTNACYRVEPDLDTGVASFFSLTPPGSTTSYSYDQGPDVNTHVAQISWDNKWLALHWVYYYYHCGQQMIFISLEDPTCYAKHSETGNDYFRMLAPFGPSGFKFGRSMDSAYGYAKVYAFDGTLERFKVDNTTFDYKMRHRSYHSGASAYSVGTYEEIVDASRFDNANGMVWRTNINVGGSMDNAQTTGQIEYPTKGMWRTPTVRVSITPLNYWYQTFPDGTDNSSEANT